AILDHHIGRGHALVRAIAAVEYGVDGGGCRTGTGDVEGQVVVPVVALYPTLQGAGAAGGQGDGGRDRVVAIPAPGLEGELAGQLAGAAHGHLRAAAAAVHLELRPGPGGDGAVDGEAQDVVAVVAAVAVVIVVLALGPAALHLSLQGAGAAGGQGDGGIDRVV